MKTASDVPQVVYHYTSMETLLKIYSTSIFWASNIRYLNDHSERQFFLDELRIRIPNFLQAHPEIDKTWFEKFREEYDVVPSFAELPFVASFSLFPDSLPQWRAYCSGGNGVSIGIHTESLMAASVVGTPEPKPGKFYFVPQLAFKKVQYFQKGDSANLDSIILQAVKTAESDQDEIAATLDPDDGGPPSMDDLLWSSLEGSSAITKDIAFLAEGEYRLSAQSYIGTGHYLKYRPTRATLIPYMEIHLPDPKTLSDDILLPFNTLPKPSFIHDVVVAPSPNQKLTMDTLNYMFGAKGHTIPVAGSRIPYRDWL